MSALSAKLRDFEWKKADRSGIAFWCPGCGESHSVTTRGNPANGPLWHWDGDVEAPTLSPSILVRKYKGQEVAAICHSFVRAGKIEFLGDCTHPLAGQTVSLPDWPTAGDEAGFYLGQKER